MLTLQVGAQIVPGWAANVKHGNPCRTKQPKEKNQLRQKLFFIWIYELDSRKHRLRDIQLYFSNKKMAPENSQWSAKGWCISLVLCLVFAGVYLLLLKATLLDTFHLLWSVSTAHFAAMIGQDLTENERKYIHSLKENTCWLRLF